MINLPPALKSKRLWIAIVTAIVGVIIALVPELQDVQTELITALTVIAGVLIGGYSAQDAVVSAKSGTSKYDTHNTD